MTKFQVRCKDCGYYFGKEWMAFIEELKKHVLKNHNGYCEIGVGVTE